MATAAAKMMPMVEAVAHYESKRAVVNKSYADLAHCVGRIVALEESMRPPHIPPLTK
jgi:hypothetical protein